MTLGGHLGRRVAAAFVVALLVGLVPGGFAAGASLEPQPMSDTQHGVRSSDADELRTGHRADAGADPVVRQRVAKVGRRSSGLMGMAGLRMVGALGAAFALCAMASSRLRVPDVAPLGRRMTVARHLGRAPPALV